MEAAELRNGQDVLDALDSGLRVDVALINGRMPVMDGWQATRELRSRYPELSVVMFSLSTYVEAVDAARAAGDRAFLSSNAPPKRWIEAIRTVAAGGTWFSPAYDGNAPRDVLLSSWEL